jgi:hypothetical protein
MNGDDSRRSTVDDKTFSTPRQLLKDCVSVKRSQRGHRRRHRGISCLFWLIEGRKASSSPSSVMHRFGLADEFDPRDPDEVRLAEILLREMRNAEGSLRHNHAGPHFGRAELINLLLHRPETWESASRNQRGNEFSDQDVRYARGDQPPQIYDDGGLRQFGVNRFERSVGDGSRHNLHAGERRGGAEKRARDHSAPDTEAYLSEMKAHVCKAWVPTDEEKAADTRLKEIVSRLVLAGFPSAIAPRYAHLFHDCGFALEDLACMGDKQLARLGVASYHRTLVRNLRVAEAPHSDEPPIGFERAMALGCSSKASRIAVAQNICDNVPPGQRRKCLEALAQKFRDRDAVGMNPTAWMWQC